MIDSYTDLETLVTNVQGTDGNGGPSNVLSMGGTQAGGELEEVLVDSSGRLQIDIAEQSDSTPLSVYPNGATGTDGKAPGAYNVVMAGGFDGTNAQYLATDTNGYLQVEYPDLITGTDGKAPPAYNGMLAMGFDGTNSQWISTDNNGYVQVEFPDIVTGTDGKANASYNGLVMLGNDGTNSQYISTDANGYLQVEFPDEVTGTDGKARTGYNFLVVGGHDGTDAQYLLTDSSGRLRVDIAEQSDASNLNVSLANNAIRDYPLSTTACADAAVLDHGILVHGFMVQRIANSATDDTVFVRDGTDAAGTIKGISGLQSAEGGNVVMYPNPVSFGTGVFLDFVETGSEICVQVICAETCS